MRMRSKEGTTMKGKIRQLQRLAGHDSAAGRAASEELEARNRRRERGRAMPRATVPKTQERQRTKPAAGTDPAQHQRKGKGTARNAGHRRNRGRARDRHHAGSTPPQSHGARTRARTGERRRDVRARA